VADQQHLIEITREAGCRDILRYEHRRVIGHELRLALPDAIAWCWARAAGSGAPRVQPLVAKVRQV
jgi:hypothetical protein